MAFTTPTVLLGNIIVAHPDVPSATSTTANIMTKNFLFIGSPIKG
jgi:hypothetical protein